MPRKDTDSKPHLRILVSGCLPPPLGGMATFYESLLASSLSQRVDLAFVNTSSQKRTFEEGGRVSFSNLQQSLADCWRFARAINRHHPVVAHIGTAYGLSFVKHSVCVLIARFLGSKVLLHPHCSFAVLYADRSRLWKWYFRRVMSLVNGLVALSQEWLAVARVAPHCKVYTLPNAVCLEPYAEVARKRTASSERAQTLHVLYLGHVGKEKGSFDLLEAARLGNHHRQYEIKLIGGDLTPGGSLALRENIKAAGLQEQIDVYPPVVGPEKLAIYRWADIFIYPSYAEGMPMAVIEAMACGLPVIASRVGGLPDLVTDGVNGFLVDPGCPEQIAVAIGRLADDQTRLAMGKQSYQRATSDYDFENRVEQMLGVYSAILSQN